MTISDIYLITKQVLDVQSKGLFHRDIKTDNFFNKTKRPNFMILT